MASFLSFASSSVSNDSFAIVTIASNSMELSTAFGTTLFSTTFSTILVSTFTFSEPGAVSVIFGKSVGCKYRPVESFHPELYFRQNSITSSSSVTRIPRSNRTDTMLMSSYVSLLVVRSRTLAQESTIAVKSCTSFPLPAVAKNFAIGIWLNVSTRILRN